MNNRQKKAAVEKVIQIEFLEIKKAILEFGMA